MDQSEFDRLAITCPPRHGKSELVTIRRPAYRLERDPTTRFIIGAYNNSLAKKFSRRTRGIVRQRNRVRLNPESQDVTNWETALGGGLMSAGVGTGVTGHGANEIIIDDPVKSRAEANSRAYRDAVWDWYTDDLYTRLEPGANIILIMTRWDEDDLMGRILLSEDKDTWTLCHLPAVAEDDDELGRPIGAALCPERYDEEALARIKTVLKSSYHALYQGRPVPQEGNIILSSWFRYYRRPEQLYRQIVQSWDCANKERDMNDWSVCTTWGVHNTGYDLLDEWRERVTYPKLYKAAIEQAELYDPAVVLIEDRGNGTALIQDLKVNTRVPVVAIEPVGDKVMRLSNESPAYESGLVRHPKQADAPWITDHEAELVSIPATRHDDRGDSVSQFLKWAKKSAGRLVYASLPREGDHRRTGVIDVDYGYGALRSEDHGY